MLKPKQVQRLMLLFAIAGLFAVAADFACLDDVCADLRVAEYRSLEEIRKDRVETLDEAAKRQGIELSAAQLQKLKQDGQLLGVVKLDRPVKHPNGTVEVPKGWLPEIPEGHPWRSKLGPTDDAFYSYVEERLFKSRMFDPSNAEHMKAAEAYLSKANSATPEFVGWTYADRTECQKKKIDAKGVGIIDAAIK